MVRDLGEPTKQFLPFIYHEWIDNSRIKGDSFDHYLCFFNLDFGRDTFY